MKASRWPSGTLPRLSRREQRVVLGGAVVSGFTLAVVLVALPLAHRWSAREAIYAANQERWVRLEALVSGTERLRQTPQQETLARAAVEARLITGATATLAASSLQALLQRYADESAVQLDRVDVASEPHPDRPGLLAIPVQLQGEGDIYGLVALLSRLDGGDKLLVTDELTVASGADGWRAGERHLSWAIRLHGLYRVGASGGGS